MSHILIWALSGILGGWFIYWIIRLSVMLFKKPDVIHRFDVGNMNRDQAEKYLRNFIDRQRRK